MSNFVSYEAVQKFAENFDQSNLDDKLEALGVKDISEAIEHFGKYASDDVTPVIIDNKESVSLFYSVNSTYVDRDDNPLEGNPEYVNFKAFTTPDERDDYLRNKNPNHFYLVEKYEHGAVHYSLSRTADYPDRRWDVTPDCAVLEIGKELRQLRKALKTKHGEDEGTQKFHKHLNEMLDDYSSYCNGYASEIVEVVVEKESGEIDVQRQGVFFSSKFLKLDMAYHVFNAMSYDRIKQIQNEIVEVGVSENLKGFDNNILRKGATKVEVFKHTNEEGLESKMAIVSFPDKMVTYIKSHDKLYEHLEAKNEQVATPENQIFKKNAAIRNFARNIAISEFMENAARYDLEKENSPTSLKMR